MLRVYITIDTEYSAGRYHAGSHRDAQSNHACSIAGTTSKGAFGIGYQMDVFEHYGLKAIFFVDPMPALIWGVGAIERVVQPIVARGHDVQLHIHTEWLEFAPQNPVGRTGGNIKDFTISEQTELIAIGADLLERAGAPRPVAFRAGNFGANDDTLRALAANGLRYESSFGGNVPNSLCTIDLPLSQLTPVERLGVTEVPVSGITDKGGRRRHAQITAISAAEMLAAIRHAHGIGQTSFTVVSHSFELLSRDRMKVNHIVARRFDDICAGIAAMDGVDSGTFSDTPPVIDARSATLPKFRARHYVHRIGEQLASNALYGRI
jgi:hypothetical protein